MSVNAEDEPPAHPAFAALGPAFLDALLADFAAHGAEAIRRCREESPATYLRICAGLLPKQLKIEGANELDDAELDKRIRQLAGRLALEIGAGGAVDGEGEAAEPQSPPGLPALR
jgi:hypothetical protein